jgi:hypothetical protein
VTYFDRALNLIFLNTLKITNFEKFKEIVDSIDKLELESLGSNYAGLTDLDKKEEIFVRMFSNKISKEWRSLH